MAQHLSGGEEVSTDFNPTRSSKTKLLAKTPSGARIYSHTARDVAGTHIVCDEYGLNWEATASYDDAVKLFPQYSRKREEG